MFNSITELGLSISTAICVCRDLRSQTVQDFTRHITSRLHRPPEPDLHKIRPIRTEKRSMALPRIALAKTQIEEIIYDNNQQQWTSYILLFIHSFIHQWLYSPLLGPGLFFSFVIFFYTDGRTPWTSDQPVARPLPAHRTAQTQISMPLSGIRTHAPSVRASEDISCLTLPGHCDRLHRNIPILHLNLIIIKLLLIYLHAELNSQWSITTAITQPREKKNKEKGSAKDFYTQTWVIKNPYIYKLYTSTWRIVAGGATEHD
jgi:hypothetical protein